MPGLSAGTEDTFQLNARAFSDVITRIIVKLNAVESPYRASVRNHRFSSLKSMTNLVHARRRLVSRHVTMAEAMKMSRTRDDARHPYASVIFSDFYNNYFYIRGRKT